MTAGYVSYERCEVPRNMQVTGFYTASEQHFVRDYYFEGESHDFWELVYVVDGTAGVAAGQNVYSLTGGQMILHLPMEFHRIWAADGTTPRVIILTFSAQGLEWRGGRVRSLSAGSGAHVLRIMELVKENFETEGILVKSIRKNCESGAVRAAAKLEYLLLSAMEQNTPSDIRDDSQPARLYRSLVAVMEENLGRAMSMQELTQACGLSESSVKRMFARYAGIGPMRYFMEMKIRRAMALLAEGHRVGAVSEMLGFENQNYFCTAFKRVAGVSPTQFRKLQD